MVTWEPGHRLAYTSTLAQPPDRPSTFTTAGAGTRVEFEHGGWADGLDDVRAKFGDWPLILDRYVALLEADPTS